MVILCSHKVSESVSFYIYGIIYFLLLMVPKTAVEGHARGHFTMFCPMLKQLQTISMENLGGVSMDILLTHKHFG